MNIVILCGGSGNRIDRFDVPKALYPLWPDTCALTRMLRQFPGMPRPERYLATGFQTEQVLEVAPGIQNLSTWNDSERPGTVWAIRQMMRHYEFADIKIILGDTVWSQWDMDAFLMTQAAPIVFYHDDKDDQYSETYGLSMDAEGIDIFKRLVDSCDYMQPLNQEIGFGGIERIPVLHARLGHFERAIDFSTSFQQKKIREVAHKVMDFDDERGYQIVNARLQLGWFD